MRSISGPPRTSREEGTDGRFAILASSFWVALSVLTGRGAVVVSGILLSNVLGAAAFATFVFLHLTATAASSVATVGMHNALPRYLARLKVDHTSETISHIVAAALFAAIGLTATILIVVVLPTAVLALPSDSSRAVLVLLLAGITLNNLSIGAANGLEKFRLVSLATAVQGAVLLIAAAISSVAGNLDIALWGYVVATLASTAVLAPVVINYIAQIVTVRPIVLNGQTLTQVGLFCGPLFAAAALLSSGIWFCSRALLSLDDGAEQMAAFALGLQWFGMISLMPSVIGRVVLPRVTRHTHYGESRGSSQTVLHGLQLSIGSTLIAFTAVLISSGFIVSLYGAEIGSARLVLLLFVGTAVVASPIDVVSSALIARNHQLAVFGAVTVWWITVLGGIFALHPSSAFDMVLLVAASYGLYLAILTIIAARRKLLRHSVGT